MTNIKKVEEVIKEVQKDNPNILYLILGIVGGIVIISIILIIKYHNRISAYFNSLLSSKKVS